MVELTKELEECIGDGGLQTHLDKEDIGEMLSHFLETVDKIKELYFSGGTGTRIQLKIFQKGCR